MTADSGGSNGWRLRPWSCRHFLPDTRKRNRIERRLFSFTASSWCGGPLRDYKTIVELISATMRVKGL